MEVQGFFESTISRMGSLIDWDDPTLLPLSLAVVSQNTKYLRTSVTMRDGISRQMSLGNGLDVRGLALLAFKGDGTDTDTVLGYGSDGNLYRETPVGSGTAAPVDAARVNLPAGAFMQATTAFNRSYMGFGDLIKGTGKPAVLDGATNLLDPASYLPLGSTWNASRKYFAGEVVSPAVSNGHLYRAQNTGIAAGVEPTWPTGEGATVVDGAVTWQETTPVASNVLPVPAIPSLTKLTNGFGVWGAGKDIYIKTTFVNPQGETDITTQIAGAMNVAATDMVQVSPPARPAWVQALGVDYAPTAWRCYVAAVAPGAAAPPDAAYANVGGDTNFVTNIGVGGGGVGAGPSGNSAFIAPAGNVCSGDFWMVTLFENRNGHISGMTDAVPVQVSLDNDGARLYCAHIATGPANTAKRIVAFTVPGKSKAGEYWYLPKDDEVEGIPMTKTVIEDNVSTTATFNFTPEYLITGIEVTNRFRVIELPACGSAYFAKSLNRVIYGQLATEGDRSGFYVSLPADPETVFGDTNFISCASNDNDIAVGWHEWGGVQYVLKENSGHTAAVSGEDPRNWQVTGRWEKVGLCGPLAIDSDETGMMFVHTSGVYRYTGQQPYEVAPELRRLFKRRVNWQAKHKIWLQIDKDNKQVHVGLPLDGSAVCNYELVLNYGDVATAADGWTTPITFTKGQTVALPGRRWSLNTISANMALRVERTLAAPPVDDIANQQFLYASAIAAHNGAIQMAVPRQHYDVLDGVTQTAIAQEYEPGYVSNSANGLTKFGGIAVNADGSGVMLVSIVPSRGTERSLKPCGFPEDGAEKFYTCGARWNAQAWSPRFRNRTVDDNGDPVIGDYFNLRSFSTYTRLEYAVARG